MIILFDALKNYTKKTYFEFAMVSIYKDIIDYKSHLTHRFIISGYMGYFWILV